MHVQRGDSTHFACLTIVQCVDSGTSHTYCDPALCHQVEEGGFLSSPCRIWPLHQLHLETLPKMNVSQKGDSPHCLECWLGV